jgi:hypothetical protein
MGVGGGAVEQLIVDGLSIVASKFDTDRVSVSRENILRHEAIVRNVLAMTTPLPFRFGTLVTEAGLRSYVTSRKAALQDRLEVVKDSVEMSIKVIWQSTDDDESPATTEDLGVGAAFLVAKRQELFGDERLVKRSQEIADWLSGRIKSLVKKENVSVHPKQKLVLAGAYLIQRAIQAQFRTRVEELAVERPELHFLTSGPWPPYTFANIDLEFETQFGVS